VGEIPEFDETIGKSEVVESLCGTTENIDQTGKQTIRGFLPK
jgi:hypothetical protein